MSNNADVSKDKAAHNPPVVKPISVSTTFIRDQLESDQTFVYSRVNNPSLEALEKELSETQIPPKIDRSKFNVYAAVYSSGLACVWACLTLWRPKRVLFSGGYHGVKQVFDLHGSVDIVPFHTNNVQANDLIWLETPQNSFGQCHDIQEWVKVARRCGANIVIDSTLAPPPIQYCLVYKPDIVLHSLTKFYGGHSDLLGGALFSSDRNVITRLKEQRTILGSCIGSLETFLLLRSVKSLNLRVRKQAETAELLSNWLREESENKSIITYVHHQKSPFMNSFCPIIFLEFKDELMAKHFVTKVKVFRPATSLGGVESLVDYRAWHSDDNPKNLIRISVGLEDPDILIQDAQQAISGCKSIQKNKSLL